MIEEKTIGTVVATTKTPEQIRSLILNKIGEGFNTMAQLITATSLDNSTTRREIGFLNGLIISIHPGPPIQYAPRRSAETLSKGIGAA